MGQLEAIVQDKIGLPEGVRVIAYRSLYASLTISERGSNSYYGPIRVVCSAAILLTSKNVGPYGSLVQHFAMHLMAQFEPIVLNEIG